MACPYIASKITPKGVATLKKRDGEILKVKYNFSQFKLYVEEKTADTGGDTTEFTVAIDNEKLSTSVNTGTSTPLDCNEIDYWDSLPNELVEKILLCTIKKPGLQTNPKSYLNVQKVSLRYITLLTFFEINKVVKPRQNLQWLSPLLYLM